MIGPQPPPDEEALIAFIRDYIDQLSEPNREILTKVISELARRLFGR
ncbi:MAG: hypothetical protein IJG60_06005 [Thermoguttaceae bacterium]|nr:hypothetical protein [Thermoguttaceae bacterium]